MNKLRGIAERLRSDNANERQVAVTMIERQTSKSITAVIEQGAKRKLVGQVQAWVLNHTNTHNGDRMIVAIGRELEATNTSWADIIEAGASDAACVSAEQGFAGAWSDLFSGMFKEAFGNQGAPVNEMHYRATAAQNPDPSVKPKPVRTSRDDLPEMAGGVPKIMREGIARNGRPYAVVMFPVMTTTGLKDITPVCEFIGFGEDFVARLKQAASDEDSVFVKFGSDRSPNKAVIISEVR